MSQITKPTKGVLRGLPAALPEGERVLWRGQPSWRGLARTAFMTRNIAIYFALLAGGRALLALLDGDPMETALLSALWMAPLAAIALGVLAAMAWAMAKATIYTITNRRVVIASGLVLPLCVNVPFSKVARLDFKPGVRGEGDLAMGLSGEDRFAVFALWPNVRPWRLKKPEPSLRAVPDAQGVGEVLAQALRAAAVERGEAAQQTPAPQIAPEPVRPAPSLGGAARPSPA